MSNALATLLGRPRTFFREGPHGRLAPVLIVAATGAVTLAAQLLLVSLSVAGDRATISYVSTALQVELPAITVAGAAISFGHVFVYWLVYAGVFTLGSAPFADEGSFGEVFWLTGWGFVPWVLTGAVWLAAMIVGAQATPLPTTPAQSDVFVRQVQQTPWVVASRHLDSIGTAWSLGLWTVLVRERRGVAWWQAGLAVAPVAAFEVAKTLLL